MPNAVGGYMPSQAMTPKVENGKPNSVVYALSRGYVVASPATRGRTNKRLRWQLHRQSTSSNR